MISLTSDVSIRFDFCFDFFTAIADRVAVGKYNFGPSTVLPPDYRSPLLQGRLSAGEDGCRGARGHSRRALRLAADPQGEDGVR